MIDVALLGTGGMMPLPNRWLASAMLRANGRVILIDCGEGAQIAGRLHGFGFREIDAILLTHFHADHILGLPGVIFMLQHSGRDEPVVIAGPVGVREVVRHLLVLTGDPGFPIATLELTGGEQFPVGDLLVSCVAGDHRGPVVAYRVDAPRPPRFRPEAAAALGVPRPLWRRLQHGEPVEVDGRIVQPTQVAGPPRPGLRVGYVTDTRVTEAMPAFFANADLLICEATFADPAQADRAIDRKHLLFREAAQL
ncbi:MAG: ribonuclease Z, partial [Dehalococcoidia bacterium]|nr:ribonuclease Z [Dehalococcoidia bacterium]